MSVRTTTKAAARSDGKTLFIMSPSGREHPYEWQGPAGAKLAEIDEQRFSHPFGSQLCVEIRVYDAEGTFLGRLEYEDWS